MSPETTAARPVSLFYSYAHEDEPLRDELRGHLKILERRGMVSSWHDRQIVAGQDWHAEIDQQLKLADVVLLLISTDFINSDYILGTELTVAMQRHTAGFATVVPIIVRAVDIAPEDVDAFPFMKLQGLPTDLRPVTSWPNRDEAWTNVAKGLRATVKAIHDKRAAAASTTRGGRGAPRPGPVPAAPPPPAPVAAGPLVFDSAESVVPPPPPAPEPEDPLLTQVIDGFTSQVREANAHRGGASLDEVTLRSQALGLIDEPEQKRVLWVDDKPQGNHAEIAALAKLQLDVQTVTSTSAALKALEEGSEGFDLVISDWERPLEGPGAGLRLLSEVRRAGFGMPLVFYHGQFVAALRSARAEQAKAAGALGEAVYPGELVALVLEALSGHSPKR